MTEHAVIQKDLVSDRLYQDLLTGIIVGEYPANSQLPTELSLARDYGVSRTIVRSALELLKSRGYISSRQGSGTVVVPGEYEKMAPLLPRDRLAQMEQCYECRLAIEPEIAAIVADRLPPEAVFYLQSHIDELECSHQVTNTHAAADLDFHIKLAEHSGNSFFESIMNSLRPHILFSMNITKTLPKQRRAEHVKQSKIEHLQIATAIIGHDPDSARKFMRRHIANGRKRIFHQ